MAKGSGTTRIVNASNSRTSKKERGLPLSNISVETNLYRGELAKNPSGTGNWFFSIGNKEGYKDVTKAVSFYGTYTEAVKKAKKEAQKRGAGRVYVLP